MQVASDIGGFFGNTATQIAITIVIVIVIQLIIRDSLGHIVKRAVSRHRYESQVDEQKREDTLIHIFRTANAAILWIIGLIVILGELHINIATLLTGAGLIGVVVGLGAQNIIKDYLAGIFIILENQYRVGDIITLNALGVTGGISGVVEDITIRITKLRDLDGNLHIISNGLAGVITNMTFKYANVNVNVGVSYHSDIDNVEKVINEVGLSMAGEDEWKKIILEPIQFLRVDSFDSSAVTVKALGKVQPSNQWTVAGEFRRRLKAAFDKHGIEIPLPQVVVHQPKAQK